MPSVVAVLRAPKRGWPMEELAEAIAIKEHGFQSCVHARPNGTRQVLLVDRETLDALDLRSGMIRENITTEGLNVNGLSAGETLQIGEVVLEVTVSCTPCGQMEALRPGLRKEIRGRRGMMCRITKGGIIRQGDAIEKRAKDVGSGAAAG